MPADDLFQRLASRRLLVVTGKGGVGKTAVTAVLGRLLARRRRVLVFEVDPRENLHRMLGVPPSGGEVTEVGGGLFLQNLKPREVVDAIVRERLKLEALTRRVLESPVYQHFAEGAPGLKEVAVLGHALRLLRGIGRRGEGMDCVVLDAPATGHGVAMLTAPRLLSDVIRKGPFGNMGRELAEFVADPGQVSVVVVTSPEEMPVDEALELRSDLLERFGREPELLVVNGLYPPLPEGEEDSALDLWRRRRRLNEKERRRLVEAWEGPRVELPHFPLPGGPELVDALAGCLRVQGHGVEEVAARAVAGKAPEGTP